MFHVRSTKTAALQRVVDARYASLVSVAQRVHVKFFRALDATLRQRSSKRIVGCDSLQSPRRFRVDQCIDMSAAST